MGRLSHIRHKNKQKSSFSANDFVNGIQVSLSPIAVMERLVSSSLPLTILKSVLVVVKVRASAAVSRSVALRVPQQLYQSCTKCQRAE
jgi:hypothetical protein